MRPGHKTLRLSQGHTGWGHTDQHIQVTLEDTLKTSVVLVPMVVLVVVVLVVVLLPGATSALLQRVERRKGPIVPAGILEILNQLNKMNPAECSEVRKGILISYWDSVTGAQLLGLGYWFLSQWTVNDDGVAELYFYFIIIIVIPGVMDEHHPALPPEWSTCQLSPNALCGDGIKTRMLDCVRSDGKSVDLKFCQKVGGTIRSGSAL